MSRTVASPAALPRPRAGDAGPPQWWVLATSVALTYGVGAWMTWLRGIATGADPAALPPVWAWLENATLGLPAVTVAVQLAVLLSDRLEPRTTNRRSILLVAALAASVVAAVTGSGPHALVNASLLPRDLLLALAVAAPLALATAAVGPFLVGLRRWWSPARLQGLAVRVSAGSLALSGLALTPGLVSTAAAASDPGNPCPVGLTADHQRTFDVTALDVKIPLNRYGDNDPAGKMYLATTVDGQQNMLTAPGEAAPRTALAAVRAQESSQQVSIGLRDDPIQPLSIRANEGDCVTIQFTNQASGGSYGLHIDGLAFDQGSSGDNIGTNGSSAVGSGSGATYRFWIPNDPNLEGSHYVRPGPGYRSAVDHGLFGTLTVEPPGSTYLDASTAAKPLLSGWEAIIAPAATPAFREAVKMHHEVGNDNETIFSKAGVALPQVDATTGSYRPGEFALNYRSEPFRNRLLTAGREKSHAYSSYTFGDPSTPMPRGYVGDPTKFRIVHAGGEKFHVYHLHGGGDRWRYSPVADTTYKYADTRLDKHPKTVDSPSNRLDAQSIGPGESYNLEIEGGAGGVQHTVGDLLFHCHIAKHYVSGMWSFWRVYDTLQPQSLGQDALAVLPDRAASPDAVDSTDLLGRTMPDGTVLDTPQKLDDWLRPQLPPAGVRGTNTQDPSVWNWKVDTSDPAKPVYLGEPEDTASPVQFPDLRSELTAHPGLLPVDLVDGQGRTRLLGSDGPNLPNRPRLLFNPTTGRPAYPLLRTHAGTRPPFSPNGHSGSPFLGERGDATAAAGTVNPWAARPDGLCPRFKADGTTPTPVRHFNITAMGTPVQRSKTVTDAEGKLFVLAGTQDAVRAKPAEATPLAIRTNVGDCDRVTLTNEMGDSDAFDSWSKTTIHIHHVQFDVQGSDGVSTGFAFEHSVRPYKQDPTRASALDADPTLTAPTAAGDTVLHLSDVRKFQRTDANANASHPFIAIGQGTNGIEVRQVKTVTVTNASTGAGDVTVDQLGRQSLEPGDTACADPRAPTCTDNAVTGLHAAGEYAGIEFIQYEWYADVLLDNIFWHDHVDGIHGWGHGLVGQLVVEPSGSTYHDPKTGEKVDSGTIVDVRVNPSDPAFTPVAKGVKSFREMALWTIDDNDRGDYSTLNLKAEPFVDRPDAANRFSSYKYGDPFTPMPRAYAGDPVVVRTINVSPSMDTLHFQGPRFRNEWRYQDANGATEGTLLDTLHNGMSEKFSVVLDGGPGTTAVPGDYLYSNGDARRTRQGAWGIVRVLDGNDSTLQPLPGNGSGGSATSHSVTGAAPPPTTDPGNVCPAAAPVHAFAISAVDLPGGNGTGSAAYVMTRDVAAVRNGSLKPAPLALHVAAGECLAVSFTNDRVPALDPVTGAVLGTPRASFAVGELLHSAASSGANVGWSTEQTAAPGGGTATYRYYADTNQIGTAVISDFGADDAIGTKAGMYGAVVVAPEGATFTDPVSRRSVDEGVAVDVKVPGRKSYRDFTLVLADNDPRIGQDFMPYPTDAEVGATGINYRTAPRGDGPNAFAVRNPGTPVLTSYAGDPVVVHQVVAPGSEQAHVFNLGGMAWPRDPFVGHSELTSNQAIGPGEAFDAEIDGGAGGRSHSIGDYFYGDLRRPFTQNGVWGLQRVLEPVCAAPGQGIGCLNSTAPQVGVPAMSLATPGQVGVAVLLASSTAPLSVSWTSDQPAATYQLQLSANGAAFSDVRLGDTSATSALVDVPLGTATSPAVVQLRVQGCAAGACGGWVNGPVVTLSPADDGLISLISYSGTWATVSSNGSYGGGVHSVSASGPRAQLKQTFSASSSVAWVGAVGPDRGKASVSVDGGTPVTVNLAAANRAVARTVWRSGQLAGGRSHTVTVTSLGQPGSYLNGAGAVVSSTGTRVDVDAFVTLR